jgi:hypothetical protein
MAGPNSKNPMVTAYLKQLEGPQKEIVLQLREIVMRTNKSITEDIKWKNCLTFMYGGKNIIQTVVGKNHTTFIFFDGTKLKDPHKLLFGEGKTVRSARFPITDINSKAVQDLVQQAIALHKS